MKPQFSLSLITSTLLLAVCSISTATANTVELKTEEQKVAYATGATFGDVIRKAIDAKDLNLDPKVVVEGFSAMLNGKSQMTTQEIEKTISEFNTKMAKAEQEKLEKEIVSNTEAGDKFRQEFEKKDGVKKTASGLLYKIEKEGTGKAPTAEDTVVVHYRGKLIDGREFDSSYSRNEPATFPLSGVIKGWTEGLQMIKEGGKATLVIPPELAYGETNIPGGKDRVGISPKSTLVFDVELVEIQKAK